MAINTAGDLIALALRTAGVLGVGQTSGAEDTTDALALLNMTLAQWQRKRWLVSALTDTAVLSTGASSYTVGPAGAFAIPRPDRIETAFARMPGGSNPLDLPLAIISAPEDYAAIGLKALTAFPAALFYESAYPNGVAHFWPIPPANTYELHIGTKAALPVYSGLTTALGLPPEYIEALLWTLAVKLQMTYGLPARADHVGAMTAALNTLRQANVQIPTLGMPAGVGSTRSGSVAASGSIGFQSGAW